MMCPLVVWSRSISATTLKAMVALGALVFVLAGTAGSVDISIGNQEVIYTKTQRTNKKLSTWPDGSLGVLRNAQGNYEFYGANGGSPVKTTGSLWTPGNSKKAVSIY